MSTAKGSVLFSSAALRVLRSALSAQPPARPLSSNCLRLSQNARYAQTPFKRHAATAAAYRTETFDTTPPPRSADVPETSIAGGQSATPTLPRDTASTATGNVSIPEQEAQKSTSVGGASAIGSVATPEQSTQAKPRPARKLRPRKAAMTLSSAAVEQLRELLAQPEPKLIRVGVKNRGCSGLAYNLEYVEKPGVFDEAVDQDGVKVLIDSKALFSIIGSEMDWVEDKLSRRFVFRNPNITEQCGCGESFSVG